MAICFPHQKYPDLEPDLPSSTQGPVVLPGNADSVQFLENPQPLPTTVRTLSKNRFANPLRQSSAAAGPSESPNTGLMISATVFIGLAAACFASFLVRRAATTPPLLINAAGWEHAIPSAVKKVLSRQTTEEIIHQAARRAQGSVVDEEMITLVSVCSWRQLVRDQYVDQIITSAIRFDLRRKRVHFFRYNGDATIVSGEFLDMVLPESPVGTDIRKILVRTTEGTTVPWQEYASQINWAPRGTLGQLRLPFEVQGVIGSGPSGPIATFYPGNSLRITYVEWNRVLITEVQSKAQQRAGETGHPITVFFHSHPPLGSGDAIDKLILFAKNDMGAYLPYLERGSHQPANMIIDLGVGRIVFSVTIPKKGRPVDFVKLMELVDKASEPRFGTLYYDDYLKAIRENFDQFLIELAPAPEGDQLIVDSVRTNPSIMEIASFSGGIFRL